MNQYQRMVSYLYEYKQGVKGVNVGFVRIEQRGSGCRISLQMRGRNLGQLSDVAVFRQGSKGIRYYKIGTLTERNGDYRCRIDTDAGNLMESGITISDVDGIILYQDDTYYVATTWKNQGVRVGEKRIWDPAEPEDTMESEYAELEPIESEEMSDKGQMALEQNDVDHGLLLPGKSKDRKDGQEDFEQKEVGEEMAQISGENGNQKKVSLLMGAGEEQSSATHLMESDRDSNNDRLFMREDRDRDKEYSFMGKNRDRDNEHPFMGENRDRDKEHPFMRKDRDRDNERPFKRENRDDERPFMGENRHRDDERPFERENRDRDDERPFMRENRGDERPFMGENRHRNDERPFMGENRDRDNERPFMRENRGRDNEYSSMGENRGRNNERSSLGDNRDREEESSLMVENRDRRNMSAPSGQNGMAAMGQRFPRWGGMPFFRRRPMGNANIPIPQMGEWGNGNRHIAESAETDTEDQLEHTANAPGQGSQISGAFQEQREQIEEEAVCRNCPFKRKSIDYGKRILMTFPVMRPFPNDQQHACVRIEPQDLGCLPMQMWTLANNHFLLQGYYCYRHLIFMETEEQGYALGVPGVYDRRTCRQAERFGFSRFRAICGGKQCAGAFGYWVMPLTQL